MGEASPPPSPSLRRGADRPGRRGRGIARLSLSLLVLRQGKLPRQVSAARAAAAVGGNRQAVGARSRIPLFRRRDQIGRAHSELQSLMRISYAVFCLKKKKNTNKK